MKKFNFYVHFYINKNNTVYLKLKFIYKNSSTWTNINLNKIIGLYYRFQ